jgi:PKD repeat protein
MIEGAGRIFHLVIIAGIVVLITAGTANAVSMVGFEKKTSSKDTVAILALSKEKSGVFQEYSPSIVPNLPPVAEFRYTVNGKTATFTDISTGQPTNWFWTFGDGTSSSGQNPTHTFRDNGVYTVTLRVLNSAGSTSKTEILSLGQSPVAAFQYSVTGKRVIFTDVSAGNPANWLWTFGDGQASTSQNPEHAYTTLGSYTVILRVSNTIGSSSITQTVNLNQPPAANFKYSAKGMTVTFTDSSYGEPTGWYWSFGDGTGAYQPNPVDTYARGGTYTVTLTASTNSGSSSVSKTITVDEIPVADFGYTFNKMAVSFNDASKGRVDSWLWSFGDGKVSGVRNPTHLYLLPGTYVVRLTVMNTAGSSTQVKEIVVTGTVYESPDVVLDEFTYIPASFTPGQKIAFPIETRNRGTATAKAFYNYFYLSTDMKYSPDDILIGTSYIDSLPAGGSFRQTVTLSVPPRIPEGVYYIVGIADATDTVHETNENNVLSTPVPSRLTGKFPASSPTKYSSIFITI